MTREGPFQAWCPECKAGDQNDDYWATHALAAHHMELMGHTTQVREHYTGRVLKTIPAITMKGDDHADDSA